MSEINDYPKVFIFHNDGGHIYRSKGVPTHKREGNPSPFQIMPVMDDANKTIELSKEIKTRADYIRELTSWKKVVIQGEKGNYLQCGNYLLPTKSAQAWYANEITESSKFKLEYCPNTGTFSFNSYNGLYLHYNGTLGTVAFKTREPSEATWHIHPLNLAASDTEQILVLGVVNKKNEFLLQRTTEGISRDWNKGLDEILETLFKYLYVQPEGSCSMFQHPDSLHQWCVTRSEEDSLNIVVSTEHFPKTIASECIEDLENVFTQFNDKEKDSRLEANGVNKTEHFDKILTAMVYDYNDQYTCSSFAAAHEEIRAAMDKMASNIEKMQENIATAEELKETTDELLEFASQFKKQSSTLKHAMWRKTAILSGVMIGGASGAMAGFFIGGPGGAAVLGFEAAEVAAGLGIGILLGSGSAAACTSRFWRRSFVSFGKKMSLSRDTGV